jgi:hypothetical protein
MPDHLSDYNVLSRLKAKLNIKHINSDNELQLTDTEKFNERKTKEIQVISDLARLKKIKNKSRSSKKM